MHTFFVLLVIYVHALIYIAYWSLDTDRPGSAVSVTSTRQLPQVARCTSAVTPAVGAARNEGPESTWPFESRPHGEGDSCWLMNSTHDSLYFLVRNSSYRAPFVPLFSELPFDTMSRIQRSQLSKEPQSPLSCFTSGRCNVSELRTRIYSPHLSENDVRINTNALLQHMEEDDMMLLSVMIAKTVIDATLWCTRHLFSAVVKAGLHMLRVESLCYEKWTFSIPVHVNHLKASELKLLRDAREFLHVTTYPPLVQMPQGKTEHLACPAIVEHFRLLKKTLVNTHCFVATSHSSRVWNLILSLFGYETLSTPRIIIEKDSFVNSSIDANAKYECVVYHRAAAAPICLSLSSESESGVEIAMRRELTLDWMFVGLLSALVGLWVWHRRIARYVQSDMTTVDARVKYLLAIFDNAYLIGRFRWWHLVAYFFVVEWFGLMYPLSTITAAGALEAIVSLTLTFFWTEGYLRRAPIQKQYLWDTFDNTNKVLRCIIIALLYMCNPEAFVWVASYSAVGMLIRWLWIKTASLRCCPRQVSLMSDDINDPEEDDVAYEKANRLMKATNAVELLQGSSSDARVRQYAKTGERCTTRALEALGATIRENPQRYARLVQDPKSLFQFAGVNEPVECA